MAVKCAAGRPLYWHWEHLLREFNRGPFAVAGAPRPPGWLVAAMVASAAVGIAILLK